MTIGIGITTTPNRKAVLAEALEYWRNFTPQGVVAYVNVDEKMEGVAKAKNACLNQLQHCDHIFLFDDDCYPIADGWWQPYIDSGIYHLMYQFNLPGKPLKELYRDDKIVAYDKTRGAMLYVTKEVLKTVGGFDTRYGIAGFEHPDYTTRIHNAGLTVHRAADVVGSDKLLYCLDQDGAVESSIPKGVKGNFRLYNKSKHSKEYMEFRS